MSVITLLTDFGLQDPYVGIMKGVILSIQGDARIVDVTHQIPPQDVVQASLYLQSAYRFFPTGSVHICVVDPGVGSDRSIIAAETERFKFLAPDNGLLPPVLANEGIKIIVRVENPKYTLQPVSRTFHGRDIFAPVGARLAAGLALQELGPSIDVKKMVEPAIPEPVFKTPETLCGTILAVDHFGNLITNVKPADIEQLRSMPENDIRVDLAGRFIDGLAESYDSVAKERPLAIIGSLGYMEIAVNCGNAMLYFNLKKGDPVRLTTRKKAFGQTA
jgi:S-adenosylmethionine hydrolase